VKFQPN